MIFVDTNVVSESLKRAPDLSVLRWLEKHDAELALSVVVIAEIAFGIEKIRPDQRASRLSAGLDAWRSRFAGRIFPLTEDAAIAYGALMGRAVRGGRPMSAADAMIAAIAQVHGCPLATRNTADFQLAGIAVVDPWASGSRLG